MTAGPRFFPEDGIARVEVHVGITPRNRLGAFVSKAGLGKKSLDDAETVTRREKRF